MRIRRYREENFDAGAPAGVRSILNTSTHNSVQNGVCRPANDKMTWRRWKHCLLFLLWGRHCITLLPIVAFTATVTAHAWTSVTVCSSYSRRGGDSRRRSSQCLSQREDVQDPKDHNDDDESDSDESRIHNNDNPICYYRYNAEVVGASGRMGSFWLVTPHHKAIAVPRGVSPGSFTSLGSPIYVATPGAAWEQVYQQTPKERRNDLVFVGNGIIPKSILPKEHEEDELGHPTFVVPHYAVLEQCRKCLQQNSMSQQEQQQKWIITSPTSPPTFLHGRHARLVADALKGQGVKTEIVNSLLQIQVAAARKLLWASCLWLVCHYEVPSKYIDLVHKYYYDDNQQQEDIPPVPPSPRTVQQVHEDPVTRYLLEQLVEELIPAVRAQVIDVTAPAQLTGERRRTTSAITDDELSRASVLQYLKDYSLSIPNAIPSIQLALSELEQRNGIWMQNEKVQDVLTERQQPSLHQELLLAVAGRDAWNRLWKKVHNEDHVETTVTTQANPDALNSTEVHSSLPLHIPEIQLTVWGRRRTNEDEKVYSVQSSHGTGIEQLEDPKFRADKKQKTVIVVGSGILGSSVAMYLARCSDITVIVVDENRKVASTNSPNMQGQGDSETRKINPSLQAPSKRLHRSHLGTTTPASWAWLHANQKRPHTYRWLNQMGNHVWKHEPILRSLPIWNGSLARFESNDTTIAGNDAREHPACVQQGGYAAEGPLSLEQVFDLEPYADFSGSGATNDDQPTGSIYFFPDEGHVDPMSAVQVLQEEAQRLGAKFLFGHKVLRFITNDDNEKTGSRYAVECQKGSSSDTSTTLLFGDTIVMAAGIGTSKFMPSLLSMDPPGQVVHVKSGQNGDISKGDNQENDKKRTQRLTRILVDTVRSSHVLQRRDGTIVAGGGTLVVGGKHASSSTSSTSSKSKPRGADSNEINLRDEEEHAKELLGRAIALAPGVLTHDSTNCDGLVYHWATAIRPMPLDGLPVVGYVKNGRCERGGLYLLLTHSGMTLGPLLGALAAGEIANQFDLDLLERYRPGRFATTETNATSSVDENAGVDTGSRSS